MPINDDSLLMRYKAAGVQDKTIAAKLGITIEEVEARWRILGELAQRTSNGHDDLRVQYQILCHQYQLVGESLKIIALALENTMLPSEVRKLIVEDPDTTLRNLVTSCIILKRFTPVDPAESLRASLERQQKGN